MKNLIVGIALVGLAFCCRSDKNASVSDPANANMPKAECCTAKAGSCSDAQKADCQKAGACCKKSEATPQN